MNEFKEVHIAQAAFHLSEAKYQIGNQFEPVDWYKCDYDLRKQTHCTEYLET